MTKTADFALHLVGESVITALLRISRVTIATFTDSSPVIQFQLCSISYNRILDAIETISENLEYFDNQGVQIDGVGGDVLNNCVAAI